MRIRLREVVRHLRKRLQMKSSRVVMNSLTLAETLVMNCHTRFHHEVATDKFMEAVARVARVWSFSSWSSFLFCSSSYSSAFYQRIPSQACVLRGISDGAGWGAQIYSTFVALS